MPSEGRYIEDMPADSAEGIKYLMEWAKAHRIVMFPHHRDIANKFGVSTEGVLFNDPIPIPKKRFNALTHAPNPSP